ncbi:unnamed protein product [Blepharisma stoltei]|uniref:Ethanolaminephosphotransferase n=1 Tax=Blepharisma stoltei TaxID=1481888 RepID=A0AAU9JTZ4_9CILI|nr:unnamed protein product [Blepharisma stoltei]
MGYLTEESINTLKNHKYKGSPTTPLMKLLDKILWSPLSKFIPNSIAPNMITLLSTISIMLGAILSLFYNDMQFGKNSPLWVWPVAGLCLWLYDTLDNLDGLHARRTGQGSPLGQLMDHGLDSSFNTFAVSFLIFQCVGLHGTSVWIPVINISVQSIFFYAAWEENYVGSLRINLGSVGVDEFAYIHILLFVITYFVGYDFFETELFSGFPIKNFCGLYICFIFLYSAICYTAKTLKFTKSLAPLLKWIPMFQVYIGTALIYQTVAYSKYTLLFIIDQSTLFGVLSVWMIICNVSKVNFSSFRIDTSLYLLYAILVYSGIDFFNQFEVHLVVTFAFVIYICYFFSSLVLEIANYLDIPVFTVKQKKS